MTKTSRVNFLLLFLLALPAWAETDFERAEKDLAEKVNKPCGLHLKVNLHDYTYGRDESSLYSNNHFEDAALLTHEMAEACRLDPANHAKLGRIRTIFIKRGSIQERKLIQRKDGDLVYLANRVKAEQSRNKGDVIREDLIRVLKLSYEDAAKKAEEKKQAAEKLAEEKAEKKAEEVREKKQADQTKKIEELTAWYQAEIKKITASPGPDMSAKIEALTKKYEEKLHAITAP